MTELINNAFTGVNIIPTVLLALILLYWITVIIGVIDFDFLDLDIDVDLDITDPSGPFHALLAFLNVAQLPFMLVISILILNFWILSMLIYLLPITPGGMINGILLIPTMIVSILITKFTTNPLKGVFKKVYLEVYKGEEVVGQVTKLLCDIKDNRLGQAEIKRDGASILINVKPEYNDETFEKNEEAYVTKKDKEKNIYYIIKIKE